MRVVAFAFFLVIAAGIVYFAVDASRESDERREQFERMRQEQQERQGELPEGYCEVAEQAGFEPVECKD